MGMAMRSEQKALKMPAPKAEQEGPLVHFNNYLGDLRRLDRSVMTIGRGGISYIIRSHDKEKAKLKLDELLERMLYVNAGMEVRLAARMRAYRGSTWNSETLEVEGIRTILSQPAAVPASLFYASINGSVSGEAMSAMLRRHNSNQDAKVRAAERARTLLELVVGADLLVPDAEKGTYVSTRKSDLFVSQCYFRGSDYLFGLYAQMVGNRGRQLPVVSMMRQER